MAFNSNSKFKVFYCQTALPQENVSVGGLYVYNNAIYLCKDDSGSSITWEKLDGLKAGSALPAVADSITGEYFWNTADKVLYYFNGTSWDGSQAKALSQDVSFTLGTGVTGSGTLSAGQTSVTIGVSAINPTYITAGALADGMTATTQTAGAGAVEATKERIATCEYVDSAVSTAAVQVMHYRGTIDDITSFSTVTSPAVGDIVNIRSNRSSGEGATQDAANKIAGSNWAYMTGALPTGATSDYKDYVAIIDNSGAEPVAVGYWERLGSSIDVSVFATLAGNNTFSGTNTFSEDTTFSQDIDVTGDVGGATLTISGDGTVSGDLGVTGDLTADDISSASITTTGNGSIGGTLGVSGATTLSNTLGVSGATTLSNTLAVTGTSTFTGTITANGVADFNGNVTIDGGASGAGNGKTFQIGQFVETTYSGPVNFDGAADFDGAVDLGSSAVAATQSQGAGSDNATKTLVATCEYVDTAITNGLTWTVLS